MGIPIPSSTFMQFHSAMNGSINTNATGVLCHQNESGQTIPDRVPMDFGRLKVSNNKKLFETYGWL